MTNDSKNAVVVGAGIAGVCTAYELSKRGYNVTVIERFPLAAQFTSMANAGVARKAVKPPFESQSAHSISSMVTSVLKSLSPTFKPNHSTNIFMDPYFFSDLTSYKWIYAFLKSRFIKQDTLALQRYESLCFDAMKSNTSEVQEATGHKFQCNIGYALIFPQPEKNTSATENVYSALTNTDLNLSTKAPQQSDIANLKLETYPESFASDCHQFSNCIVAPTSNIDFKFNTEATKILVDKENNVHSVTLDDDTILRADKVVICAGILTNNIVQNKVYQLSDTKMGGNRIKMPYIPIIPLQGFSISVPFSSSSDHNYKYPFGTMVYYPSKIYATRINDQLLRFSAYGYFRSTKHATKKWERLQQTTEDREGVQSNVERSKMEDALWDNMESCVKENLLSLYDIDEAYFDENKVKWTGFRPYTPDELPIVDEIGVNGLYVNAGHGLHGWKASHATAKLVANLMEQSSDESEKDIMKCLSLDRF